MLRMNRSITTAAALVAGMLIFGASAANADAPTPPIPDELLGYELQGISLKTDPAAVHGILLSRGFKLVPGSDKVGTREASTDVRGTYERGYSMRERRGERITYENKLSGAQESAGGIAVGRQHRRSIWYQQLYPLGTVSETQRSWSSNPDQAWVKPLFDQICAHHERVTRKNECARESWRLMTMQTMGGSIRLTPSETSVGFAQVTRTAASTSGPEPADDRPKTTR